MDINLEGFKIVKPLTEDTPIYRFMSFPSLMTILEERTIFLRKITNWDDPWEVPIKQFIGTSDIEDNYKIYGSCWSQNPDSDALWRVYSQDCRGICVSSTVGMLKTTITKNHPNLSAYLAPIIYDLAENFLLDEFFGQRYSSKEYIYPFLSACIKRLAFEHEKEIRFLIYAEDVKPPTPNFYSLDSIDYADLINEVIFDPRVEGWYFSTMSKYLAKYKISCKKSDLYTTRKLDIKMSVNLTTNKD